MPPPLDAFGALFFKNLARLSIRGHCLRDGMSPLTRRGGEIDVLARNYPYASTVNMSRSRGNSDSSSDLQSDECKRLKRLVIPCMRISGEVVKGYGRGSKEIGCPTANFSDNVVAERTNDFENGIYFGWAKVNNDDVHKAVVSIGWNPYYCNKNKSVETHILHKYVGEFYGSWLRLLICGYIRPEQNFSGLELLIKAIKEDVAHADQALDEHNWLVFKEDVFFSETKESNEK